MTQLQPILTALPTLAVATVYCFWRLYEIAHEDRRKRLRDRVTWMLWVMANDVEYAIERD